MTRRVTTSPRINEQSAEFYQSVFSSKHGGLTYLLEAFPVLYRRTMHELKEQFTSGELSLIVEAFDIEKLNPQLAGQQLLTYISDAIELKGIDKKWIVDGQLLCGKISSMTLFEVFCLEIWAHSKPLL